MRKIRAGKAQGSLRSSVFPLESVVYVGYEGSSSEKEESQGYQKSSIDFLFSMTYPPSRLWLLFFGRPTMEWTTPQHEEICLSCEISSYANAEL
jgi:hypothetical protein